MKMIDTEDLDIVEIVIDGAIGQDETGQLGQQDDAPPLGDPLPPPEPLPTLEIFDAGEDLALPPPRRWLYARQFCRKFLSSLVAPGATGKSALRTLQAIAMATMQKRLTGEHAFRQCRVGIVSLEDDIDEVRRKIEAVCKYHGIKRTDLKGWLFYCAPKGIKLAEMINNAPHIGRLETLLRDFVNVHNLDVLILDPFIKLHSLDENGNSSMDYVCELLTKLAIELNIAVDAPHHTKKGTPVAGDADGGRGAGAIRDAARLVYTLTCMSEQEADTFEIDREHRKLYVRVDSAKVNLAPPSMEATWFKLVGVRIENGDDDYPDGDEIQTVERWNPPSTWAGLSDEVLNAALTEIDKGLENGHRYSDGPSAKARAAWRVVQQHCTEKSEAQCRDIVRTWVRTGVIYHQDYTDPDRREPAKGLYLDTKKRPGTSLPD